jgi:ubiquinone/menaquinone biosynthesis C-methylase UbiE
VQSGDRVLEVGAGPGRFTIALAGIGALVTVTDVSAGQLELNRKHVADADAEAQIVERVLADVVDLSRWADDEFDVVVCYGGPLSYALDRAPDALTELVRVTRPGGHVLVSVMSLVGTFWHYLDFALDLALRDGTAPLLELARTGYLREGADYGHLALQLFRWRDLQALLEQHGEVVAVAAAGLFKADPADAEVRRLLAQLELELGREPGAVDGGEHILAVVQLP